jgi:hypothetical protein
MDSRTISDDPFAHFDRPKTLELPDFEWEFETIPIAPSAGSADAGSFEDHRPRERFIEISQITRRGIGWVLPWTGALAVLAIAAGLLAEFACIASAEHALSNAARAAAIEATLPRATYQSVAATVERRLARYPALAKRVLLTLSQNGVPVQTQFRQHEGERITVSLSAPESAGIPRWLQRFSFRRIDSRMQAEAEQLVPGRKLALSPHLSSSR